MYILSNVLTYHFILVLLQIWKEEFTNTMLGLINRRTHTYVRRPVELKWFEQCTNPDEAIKIEKQLKGWSRRKKIALIEENWDKLILYSKNYTQYGSSTSSD